MLVESLALLTLWQFAVLVTIIVSTTVRGGAIAITADITTVFFNGSLPYIRVSSIYSIATSDN